MSVPLSVRLSLSIDIRDTESFFFSDSESNKQVPKQYIHAFDIKTNTAAGASDRGKKAQG